VRSVERCICFI